MEVTKGNFKDQLKDVSAAISEAEVISLDGEFTGLSTLGHNIHALDTPAERYNKLRKGGMDFLLMQFGMSCFRYHAESHKYINKTFNFYIFPRPFNRQATDLRFQCQSSSIDFLISQDFDFNKMFKEGISYLQPGEEQRLRHTLEQKHEQQKAESGSRQGAKFYSPNFTSPNIDGHHHVGSNKGPLAVPEEYKEFIENTSKMIEHFLKSNEDRLQLPPCNAYLRKLIFSNVSPRFKPEIMMESVTNEKRQRCIQVSKVKSEEEVRDREEQLRANEMAALDDAVGFSQVIRMLSESGKLIIGHNMLLDVLHTLHQFCQPLPEEYEDFKAMTHCIFPRLVDTKLMGSSIPFKENIISTTLGELQKTLEDKPFTRPHVETAENFPGYSTDSEKLHEAGYDAYITGICFLTMANYLGTFHKPATKHVPSDSQLLQPYLNKLNLMRLYDIPYINLTGPDMAPQRDHVFHLTFPNVWKASDIHQLFSPYGNIIITWLGDTSAYVALLNKENSELVIKGLFSNNLGYNIITYEEFASRRKPSSTPQQQATKRKLPSSDVDLPPKRRRSRSNESSPFAGGNRSIHTIPEETEEDHSAEGYKKGSGNREDHSAEGSKKGSGNREDHSAEGNKKGSGNREEAGQGDGMGEGNGHGMDQGDDIGEPVPRKKMKVDNGVQKTTEESPAENTKDSSKMFDEPESW